MRKSCLYIVIVLLCFLADRSHAQEIEYKTRRVIGGLNVPWEIRWGHDGWIWFTEKPGRISRVNPETGQRQILLTAPTVLLIHESGMLGFDFHPKFPDSPYIYVAYTHEETWPAKLQLFRYTLQADTLGERKLILGEMRSNFTHVGCRVVIQGDKIFLSVGEAGDPPLAQDTASRNGKILRVNLDGSIPDDNPIPRNALWSLGHRNPQGLVFGPNGILYSSEHGTDIDDELNIIMKGQNYGWPYVLGACDRPPEEESCDTLSVIEPLYDWLGTLAVSGIDFYHHAAIPEWRNSILVAALRDLSLSVIKLDESGRRVLQYRKFTPILSSTGEEAGRLRDFCISPDGRVFISTSRPIGTLDLVDEIFELIRTGVQPYKVSVIDPADYAEIGNDSVKFAWYRTAGDSEYELQISTDSLFASAIVVDRISRDTSTVVRFLDAGHHYFWRVRELTSQGPWSDSRKLELLKSGVRSNPSHQRLSIHTSSNEVRIDLSTALNTKGRVRLISLLGETLFNGDLSVNDASVVIPVALPTGSYRLVLEQGSSVEVIGFSIVR